MCSRRRRWRATSVYVGVLNGTLEARDLDSGDLLWEFQTETSKRNAGWVLTADRKFNVPLLLLVELARDSARGDGPEFSIGSIFPSPLIVDGAVYFGSPDGYLYALE